MAPIAAPLMLASTAVSAASSIMGGIYAGNVGKAMRKQYRNQANTEAAISQRQAAKDVLQGDLARSRAITLMAASGGGGIDTPGGAKVVTDIEEQKYKNYMTTLWNGDNKARGLIYQGDIAYAEGQQKKQAAFMQGISTALSGAASFAGSYK